MAGGWSVVASPNAGPVSSSNRLYAVSCPSATACTAVGFYANNAGVDKTLAESWNGTKWSVLTTPNAGPASSYNELSGVSCVSAAACTAVGTADNNAGVPKTLAESWNGTKWSMVTTPNAGPVSSYNELYGVSCHSAAACTAVGEYANNAGVDKTLAESWNGTKWSAVATPNAGPVSNFSELIGVSCHSAAACTAVGIYMNASGVDKTLVESN